MSKIKENHIFVIAAFLTYALVLFGGLNLIKEVVPDDIPFHVKLPVDEIDGFFHLSCKLPDYAEGRSYILIGDMMHCSVWYSSTEYDQLYSGLEVYMIPPSRHYTKEFIDVDNLVLKNNEPMGFLPTPNETGRHSITVSIWSKDDLFDLKTFVKLFTVRDIDEISQRQINTNLVLVVLITGSFAVFPAIYYLRKMLRGNNNVEMPTEILRKRRIKHEAN